jgi:hypothetical protein
MANMLPSVRPRPNLATDGQTVITVVSLTWAGTTPAIALAGMEAVAAGMRIGGKFQVPSFKFQVKKVAEGWAGIQR